ncbi:VIR protein [Plasmodium vivax]|uniref:VIR protein n=1 Tax=Plasmodium vivax TaxID=5855 RepID=A0A1G4E2X4_PLAVI|nr:VIR protein [Plasmodium vivax]SCA59935.1 VIR protein [Plasmodium vivax]
MTKKSEVPTRQNLEDSLKPLELDKIYKDFFSKDVTSIYDKKCDEFNTLVKDKEAVKKVCTKLVRFVKKISELDKEEESAKHCKYLPHWLYDEIGAIHLDHSTNFGKIPYAQKLVNIGNTVNKEINKKVCTLKPENFVKLDELIKRKYMFIYYKKQAEIKSVIYSQKQYDCNKYFTYLTNIKLLYDKLKNDHCRSSFWSLPLESDYFSCRKTGDPKDLLSKAEECKNKASGSGGSTFLGILFGGSSGGTSVAEKGKSTEGPGKGVDSQTQKAGSGSHLLPAGSQRDRGVKEATASTGSGDRSNVLTTSTSHVTAAGSPRPAAEATVRNNAVAGGGLSSQVATLQPRVTMSSSVGGSPVENALAAVPATLQIGDNTGHGTMVDASSTLESVSDKLDSNFYRNIIMATAILGTIFFLFYYNLSSRLKSNFPKRKRKKKIFEHNYYEEYEREYEKYDSEDRSLASEDDRYYLNYQPERDYDY